jgi:hypothetical protein
VTAAELLRDLVEALPKTEFWTPKLHAAENAARKHLLLGQAEDAGLIKRRRTFREPATEADKDAWVAAMAAQVVAHDDELNAMAQRSGVFGKPKRRRTVKR